MSGFFDSFFIIVATIVAILSFVDWLIGKNGRRIIKERVRDFWTTIQHHPVDLLFLRLCHRAGQAIIRVFGRDRRSPRFIILATLLNLVLLVPGALVLLMLFGDNEFFRAAVDAIPASLSDVPSSPVSLAFLTVAVVAGWISFATLAWALDVEKDHGTSWWQVVKAFLKLALGSALFLGTVILIATLFVVLRVFYFRPFHEFYTPPFEMLVLMTASIGMAYWAVWPIVVGIAVLILLLALKLSRPLLGPALLLILDRLYESERGVLTQVALGLGGAAKLVQEAAKHF